jgi:probable HAF family extracellular repeat protein
MGPVAAQVPPVVVVNSGIDLGFPGAANVNSVASAVDGTLAVGSGVVDGVRHVVVADLATTPPAVTDLGGFGGAYNVAVDVDGPWAGGQAQLASDAMHAFVVDLSATTPELIDLHPAGMADSQVIAIDGLRAVGEVDGPDAGGPWWGAVWNLAGASVATPPDPILLAPQPGDPYAWAHSVSGTWAVGDSSTVDWAYTPVAWDLIGATPGTPVPAIVLPPLPDGEAQVAGVSGHWAVGGSVDANAMSAVVWDLTDLSPVAVALPTTRGADAASLGVDGDHAFGWEIQALNRQYPVVWDLSTDPPTETVLPNLGTPDHEVGSVAAVDGDWVVGYSRSAVGSDHAFAYNLATGGPMLDLGTLGLGDASKAYDIDGTWAVGQAMDTAGDRWLATAWDLLAPAPPALGTPSAGNTTVDLTWMPPGYTAGATVTGYTLAYRVTGDADWTTVQPDPVTATAITVGSLVNGTAYEFKIRTHTATADSAYSDVVTSTPIAPTTVPGVPTTPVATGSKAGVVLTWTSTGDGGDAITGHQVKVYKYAKATKRAPATYTWVTDLTTGSASTSYTVTGLKKGTVYAFTVAAINSVGPSEFSGYSNTVKG